MKYGLALGGGASKGLAHIGVLKYIEENNIEIDEISGTSMGAVIGACYALGLKSIDMQNFIQDVAFLKLIDLNLKNGVISGEKVYNKLYEIYKDELIENTKIPLKIVATNFVTGEKKVFTKGKIIDAVRASISLPGIFKPYKVEGETYIDGWIRSNLPVLELNNNNIIAVSAVRGKQEDINENQKFLGFKVKKSFFRNTKETLNRTMSFVIINNEDLTIEIAKLKGKSIVFLTPDVSKYGYMDFVNYIDIIAEGYLEADKVFKGNFDKI